jgi:hypothetical protein
MTIRSVERALRLLDPENCSKRPYGVEQSDETLFIRTSGAGGDVATKQVFAALRKHGKIKEVSISGDWGDFNAWILA